MLTYIYHLTSDQAGSFNRVVDVGSVASLDSLLTLFSGVIEDSIFATGNIDVLRSYVKLFTLLEPAHSVRLVTADPDVVITDAESFMVISEVADIYQTLTQTIKTSDVISNVLENDSLSTSTDEPSREPDDVA